MKDANGKEIKVGDRAVMLKKCSVVPRGSVGEVRDVRGNKARVTDGPEGDPNWSAWCSPSEFAIVTEPAPARAVATIANA